MGLELYLKLGLGSGAGGGIVASIKWLIAFALNKTATIGADITQNVGSVKNIPIYDADSGLILATVPAGQAASPGMRASRSNWETYLTDEELVVPAKVTASNWTPYGSNVIVDEGDAVKITYGSDDKGGFISLKALFALTKDINDFDYYVISADMKYSVGANVQARPSAGSGILPGQQVSGAYIFVRSTEYENYSTMVLTNATKPNFLLDDLSAGESVWIKNLSVKKVNLKAVNKVSPLSIVVTGDSIEAGNANTADPWGAPVWSGNTTKYTGDINAEIMHRTAANAGYDIAYENHASGGKEWDWVAATGLSRIYTEPHAIVIHCGINDVAGARTWAAVEADMDTLKASLKPWQKLFVDEILPSTNYNDAIAVNIRTFNANYAIWCAANDATLILCHDAMGQIRGSTGELDDLLTTYDKGDGIHLSLSGVDAMGAIRIAALEVALGSPVSAITEVKLHPSHLVDGAEVMELYDYWPGAAQIVAADTYAYVVGADGFNYALHTTAGGTTDAALPVVVKADIGSTVTDNDITWQVQSYYSGLATATVNYLPHVAVEDEATQRLLNSDVPATQTTVSLGTGDYVLWQNGTGSSDLTAGTATISTTGSATDGTPLPFTVTGAGTVTVTIVGTPDENQLEGGSVPTSFILSAGSEVTRAADIFGSTQLLTERFIQVRVAGLGTQTYLSDGTNVLDYDGTDYNFTDGSVTISYTASQVLGEVVVVDQTDGKLYVGGTLRDTDGTLAPSWGVLTVIGNCTDNRNDADLDPTDISWSQP